MKPHSPMQETRDRRHVTFRANAAEESGGSDNVSVSVTLNDMSGNATTHALDANTVSLLAKAKQQSQTVARQEQVSIHDQLDSILSS